MAAPYLGDFTEDSTHRFVFDTNDAAGASITLAADGTIVVYKDDNLTETSAGVTFTEDMGVDAITGVHRVRLILDDAFYVTGSDYYVVLVGATIDGQTVNAVIAMFSIEHRFDEVILANSANHGGVDAVLTLKQLSIINDSGVGMIVTGSNIGLDINGGSAGIAASGSIGIAANGTGSQGILAVGASDSAGIQGIGGGDAPGIHGLGGASGGAGILASAQANDDAGMELEAHGSGADMLLSTSGTIEDGAGNIVGVNVAEWLGTAPLGLSSQRVQVDVQAIEGFTAAAMVLGWWLAEGLVPIADSGTTTTLVDTTLAQADDYWNGALLVFRSGTNKGRTAIITDFDAATDTLTFAPAVPDAVTTEGYVLVPGLGHADIAAISQDATAADNLELGYDTTGLTGDTFPATQAQVGNLSTGSAGVSTIAISTEATLPSVVGTPTNTFAVTSQLDGIYHSWLPAGGELEFAYNFNIGPNASPTEIIWNGYARSNNDEVAVYARNWVGGSWDQIKTIEGTAQPTDQELDFVLTTAHVNTGANSGDVRIRFVSTGGSIITAFATNRILCGFTITNQSVGYANGKIWVDSNSINTNTVSFVDGVADNPAGSWANAITLSNQTSLTDFHILNGSTIALTGNSDNFSLFGDNWILALANRSVAGAHFQGAEVSGISTSAAEVHFDDCDIATMSVQLGHFDFCSFNGTVTHTLAGDYNYHNCYSKVAGPLGPTFTKTAGQTITAQWRSWKGSINLTGLEVGDTLTIGGEEIGTIDLGSPAGAVVVEIRGIYKELVNVGGAAVNLDGAILAADVALILEDTDEVQSRINDMTEDDGGTWRLTANAMENLFVVDMDQVEVGAGRNTLVTAINAQLHGNLVANAGKLTVFRTNDTTEMYQFTVTTNVTAVPITGVKD